MTTPELLPCPFCGEKGEMDGTTWRPTDGMEVGWITCNGCNAYGPTLPKIEAIAAWNTRAPLSPAIAALPAQGVREIEERKFYHDEWPLAKLLEARSLGNGLLTDDGEAWRYRLTHSDARGKYDVLFRPTRKIAALSPAEAGGVEARDAAIAKMVKVAATQLWGEEAAERVSYSVSYGDEADTEAAGGDFIWRKDALAACGVTHSARFAEQTIAALPPAPVDALVKALERIAADDEGDADLNEWGPAAVAQAALAAYRGEKA